MAIPWNEDDPRDAALIVQNLTNLLRQIARRARLRQPPTAEGNLYTTAASLSMRGDHRAMVAVFADMLDRHEVG